MVKVQLLPKVKSTGNLNLLDEPLTALLCSNRCPGDLILKTYDLARAMRDAGVPAIGGFPNADGAMLQQIGTVPTIDYAKYLKAVADPELRPSAGDTA